MCIYKHYSNSHTEMIYGKRTGKNILSINQSIVSLVNEYTIYRNPICSKFTAYILPPHPSLKYPFPSLSLFIVLFLSSMRLYFLCESIFPLSLASFHSPSNKVSFSILRRGISSTKSKKDRKKCERWQATRLFLLSPKPRIQRENERF